MIEKPLYRYSTIDSGALCRLFREDDVYIPSADDHTHPSEVMNFIDNALSSEVMYVLGRDPRYEAFIFAPSHNVTTYQGHFAIEKSHRNGKIVEKAAESGKWIFENTTCRSIISFMREGNKPARVVLGQLGLSRRGKVEKSVLYNGVYEDELIYQITIEEYNALWGEKLGRVE